MVFLAKLKRRLIDWLFDFLKIDEAIHGVKHPRRFIASCWNGANARERMMNVLSPLMPETVFQERLRFMKKRGANTAHVFMINQKDGEYAGFSPWGVGTGPRAAAVNGATVATMRARILALRRNGFAVVPWIIADDSKAWARDLFAAPRECVRAMIQANLIEEDSPLVVLGLEMNEYGAADDWRGLAMALRAAGYAGKIGTHHTSGRYSFAAMGSVVLGQLPPDCTPAQIAAQIRKIREMGREAIGFEYSRGPDRAKAQTALDAGAIGCGNW